MEGDHLTGEESSGHSRPLDLALLQLQQPLGLTWPVVLIWGKDAEKLMEFVYKNRKAHVRIELKEPQKWVSTQHSLLHSNTYLSPCSLFVTTAFHSP